MSLYPQPAGLSSASLLSSSFGYCPGARFTGLLTPEFFLSVAAPLFGCTWNYSFTLWTWLTQSLNANKTCSSAVARAMAMCHCLGRPICSAVTGAYCKARAKISASLLARLATRLGNLIHGNALQAWKWHGLNVKSVDGTLLRMLDTPANLLKYPLQRLQTPGTTYTRMRLVCMFCLSTGALLACAYAAYKGKGTGEMSLFLQLLENICRCDVLLGDRYYGNYGLLALLRSKGADGCFRLPLSWQQSFGQGIRLGEDDYLETWKKPRKSKSISQKLWDSLPAQIVVRVLRFNVSQVGFRTKEVYVVTTLTDHLVYSKEDIAALYLGRWTVEVDIRTLKKTLKMGLLSCKTLEMVEAEVWVHLLGYNLVRCSMTQAAMDKGYKPREMSFSMALNLLNEFRWLMASGEMEANRMRQILSTAIASVRVGNRLGRYEPREVKHQERKYPEMKKDRRTRRQELPKEQEQQQEAEKAGGKKAKKGSGKNRPSGR